VEVKPPLVHEVPMPPNLRLSAVVLSALGLLSPPAAAGPPATDIAVDTDPLDTDPRDTDDTDLRDTDDTDLRDTDDTELRDTDPHDTDDTDLRDTDDTDLRDTDPHDTDDTDLRDTDDTDLGACLDFSVCLSPLPPKEDCGCDTDAPPTTAGVLAVLALLRRRREP
jgi:uncharacterized protein (TIGR03382 family)